MTPGCLLKAPSPWLQPSGQELHSKLSRFTLLGIDCPFPTMATLMAMLANLDDTKGIMASVMWMSNRRFASSKDWTPGSPLIARCGRSVTKVRLLSTSSCTVVCLKNNLLSGETSARFEIMSTSLEQTLATCHPLMTSLRMFNDKGVPVGMRQHIDSYIEVL
jgi:hypothetical protein